MQLLFLTLVDIDSIEQHNIYTDLLREFQRNNHEVYIISPTERRNGKKTHLIKEDHCTILKLRIGNIQKTNIIEKGISTILVEKQFISGIKKYFGDKRFDLVLYSTPPITLCKAVEYVKKRDHAVTYLLLKDIFPQNAVDLGMMQKEGIKSILYRYFRQKEKHLYAISDRIGCMSKANVDYVVKHNAEVNPEIVEVCPNSIEVIDKSVDAKTREEIRKKYNIPLDKKVFIYGGNLGKPQGIPFLIECVKSCRDIKEAFFLIVGDGTESHYIEEYIAKEQPSNVRLMKRLPKDDYDNMVGACDVGLIFLDHRFTIPNFPSRLLSYMQAKMPVLAVTDANTDIGKVITEGDFGWWCESNDLDYFNSIITQLCVKDLSAKGSLAYRYLVNNYSVNASCNSIIESINDKDEKSINS